MRVLNILGIITAAIALIASIWGHNVGSSLGWGTVVIIWTKDLIVDMLEQRDKQ